MSRNYSSISEPKTLAADITNVATQMTLNNVTDLPSPPYVLVISPDTASEEVVLVTTDQDGVTAPTVKISRAIETGATAKPHTNGVEVRHMIVGTDLQIAHDHIDNTTTAHNLNLKAPLASPTFTGNVVLPSTTSIGNVSATELAYVDGVTSAIQTQLNTIVNTTIPNATPVGTIVMYGGTTAPTGWLLCNGQSTTGYTTLAALVGATVPDLMGRAPIGYGDSADSGITTRSTIGAKVGVEEVTLDTTQIPSHTHNINPAMIVGGGSGGTNNYAPTGNNPTSAVSITSTGGGLAHPNMQPSTVVNFIIKH
jgi:microcystin-dependent protein